MIRLFNIYGFTGGSYAGNVYDLRGISPSINTCGGGNREPMIITDMEKEEFKTVVGSKQENAYSGSVDGVSPTLTSAMGMGGGMIPMLTDASVEETKTDNFKKQERLQLPKELEGKKFRVRKLTVREVLRLQDVDEKDIDTMLTCGLSNSSIYRLAGNSITISPLYHLFRKLFIEPENEDPQLSLF